MNLKQIHLCFVGNMLGRNASQNTTQGQIVADLFVKEGCRVTCVSSKINRSARLLEIVKTLIFGSRSIDIVLLEVYSGLYFPVADIVGLLCRILKLPLIMILHGGNLPEFIQKYPRWGKRVLNRADVLVAPSSFLQEKISILGFEIQVIPNVIDLSFYPYRERQKISPNLIWMRSFHSTYNPEMAVKVLEKLRQTEPDATLTMAGNDKGIEGKIREMAKELKLNDAVRFTGFLDDEGKIREFSRADVYINTNRIDNMPVSVIEARALGLPVVATAVGGLPYLINSGEDGLLVPNEDIDSMVESIKSLIEDPELTQKISRNGRNLSEHSAWDSVRQEWEMLIKEVLEKKPENMNRSRFFGNKFASEKFKN